MDIEFITNKLFNTLNNEDRQTLKHSYMNYIQHGNKEIHYIQHINVTDILKDIDDIIHDYNLRHSRLLITVFMNPDTFIELNRYCKTTYTDYNVIDNTSEKNISEELF